MWKFVARLVLLFLLAGVLLPAAASAHATIIQTTPSDQQVLETRPRAITLKWSEAVDLNDQSIRLLDGAGQEIETAGARPGPEGPSTAVLELPSDLGDGTYIVAWRVVSTDSHPVSGAFTFSIGEPSQVLFEADGSSNATVRTIDAFARGLAFFGLALALGGAVVVFALWSGTTAPRRARRLVWAGVGLLLAGTLLVLLMQGPYATGGSLADVFSTLSFSLGTRFGYALVARIVLALAFLVLLLRGWRIPAALCGLALIFTWTLVDHSRTGVQTWLGVPAASAHLLAMAIWFGGLLVVLVQAHDAPIARFSRLAVVCWVVLAVSGVYLTYRQSGEFGALVATLFGRLLLVKTAVAIGILVLAYYSRRAVLRGTGPRGTVLGETFLGVAMLGVTAVLVNAEPARVAYVDPVETTLRTEDGLSVELKINPAKQGENVADIYLLRGDGALQQVPEVTARLLPSDGDAAALDVAFQMAEPGHFVASPMTVPYPGEWTLRMQVRTSEFDQSELAVPVKIR
jgi:copper transport protein